MRFQRLRGFKDIQGGEARDFTRLEELAREVFEAFGFEELRTPILEEEELFTRALGADTDVVEKQMYQFQDRSKTAVVLRPEGTSGIVRAYLENHFHKTRPLSKFYYLGPMFRSERPQAGRLRQFHQIGVEEIGSDSPYVDAEIIHCLFVFLEKLGVRGFELKINNLGTFEDRRTYEGVLKKYFKPHEKALCPDCRKRLGKNVFRILDCKLETCRRVIEKSPPVSHSLSKESQAHFEKVCQALKTIGIAYREVPHLVRGLDYYTKTVFELTHPALGSQDALAAGGRYDGLVESFGGPPQNRRAGSLTGAAGFALGVERLLMIPGVSAATPEDREKSYFIVTLGEAAFEKGFKILSELRRAGVKVQMDFSAKSLKSQMRSADKGGYRHVVILGDDEIRKGIFMLKDMTDGRQKEFDLGQVVSVLGGRREF